MAAFFRKEENERLFLEKAKSLGFEGYVWRGGKEHKKIEFTMENTNSTNKQVMGYRATMVMDDPEYPIKVWIVYDFAPDLYEFQKYGYLDKEYEFFPVKLTLRRIFKIRRYLKELKPELKLVKKKMEELREYYMTLPQY